MEGEVTSTRRSKGRLIGGITLLILLIVGMGLLVAAGHKNTGDSYNGLQVVAAENFYGSIASQIGGKYVHVNSIITDPQADPHLYESSAQNASEVSSADVVIINGLGYDDFMNKLLGGTNNSRRTVINASKVLAIRSDSSNPHLWYDIPKMPVIAKSIVDSFAQKDPAHQVEYHANLLKFNASLQPLLTSINLIKQQYAGNFVVYTEPVPGYVLQASGLDVKTPTGFAKSIEDGTDPSPSDTKAMEALLTNKTARILFYNSQTTSPVTEHIRNVATQSKIPVIGVTETMPTSSKTYQAWQQNQLDQIISALKTKE